MISGSGAPSRTSWFALIAAVVLAATLLVPLPGRSVPPAGQQEPAPAAPEQKRRTVSTRPDVIVIMTDDQRVGTEKGMPFLWEELRQEMTHYPNAQVPNNNCCPSRASFLTGRFSHTTGVWDNTEAGAPGGWLQFENSGYEGKTLATALAGLGYRTSLLGKYLNQYYLFNDPAVERPPGWSDFRTYLNSNGGYWTDMHPIQGVWPGYTTDALGDAAAEVVRTTPADQPLFLLYTPYAPHDPATPGPYAGRAAQTGRLDTFRRAGEWNNPSIGEQDRSDKPKWEQAVRPLRSDFDPTMPYPKVRTITQNQADTLMGVDANISKIITTQRQLRDWNNTMVVFMSDNGVAWGDHALFDKTTPYRLANGIPLLIKYPASAEKRPATDTRLINQLDVTATIAGLTGAAMTTAGHSALESQGRRGLLLHSPKSKKGYPYAHPAYCGWRTREGMYTRYSDGSEELYDYESDPYELQNVADRKAYADLKGTMSVNAHLACTPKPPDYKPPRLRLGLESRAGLVQATVKPGVRSARIQVELRAGKGWKRVGRCTVRGVDARHATRSFAVGVKGRYRVRVLPVGAYTRGAWSRTVQLPRAAAKFRCA